MPKDPPPLTSPGLGSQAWTVVPDFLHGCRGPELRSSGLSGKHFTN